MEPGELEFVCNYCTVRVSGPEGQRANIMAWAADHVMKHKEDGDPRVFTAADHARMDQERECSKS